MRPTQTRGDYGTGTPNVSLSLGMLFFRADIFPAAHAPQSPKVKDSFIYPAIYDAVQSYESDSTVPFPSQTSEEDRIEPVIQADDNAPEPPPLNSTPDHSTIISAIPNDSFKDAQPRRSTRTTAPPVRYGFATSTSTPDTDHPTYTQAMASPDKAAWQTAMQEEFDAFKRHSVGTLVDPPPGSNILGGMWVFTRKGDEFN